MVLSSGAPSGLPSPCMCSGLEEYDRVKVEGGNRKEVPSLRTQIFWQQIGTRHERWTEAKDKKLGSKQMKLLRHSEEWECLT